MIRCVLVAKREFKDEKTNEEGIFLILYSLARQVKKDGVSTGKLYTPKSNDALITAFISKGRKAQDYNDYLSIHPGALVDVHYGVNEVTQKAYIQKCELVPGTNLYKPEDLYL